MSSGALILLSALVVGYVPADPAMLAPGPDDFAKAYARAVALVEDSEAVGRAMERLHNRWAELAAAKKLEKACEDEEARSIAVRSRAFGSAHRDAVQAARAAGRRLERISTAPTVVPALDARSQERADALHERIAGEVRRWAELRAWHHRYLEPAMKRCLAKLALAPAPGLAPTLACEGGECPQAAAVIGVGGGLLCPGGQPADGRVVILPEGRACHGTADCSCTPSPVLPGAVVGP